MEYTKQIAGMVRERLVNCDHYFDEFQLDAIMRVIEDSGYSDMYEALKMMLEEMDYVREFLNNPTFSAGPVDMAREALKLAEGK